MLKGLPLTYGKDMQEDKEPLFDAADSLELGVAAMAGMVRDLKANPARMRAVASADYSVATDLADYVEKGRALAADLPGLAELRAGLRSRAEASALGDAPRFARDFETALRSMWHAWCETQP